MNLLKYVDCLVINKMSTSLIAELLCVALGLWVFCVRQVVSIRDLVKGHDTHFTKAGGDNGFESAAVVASQVEFFCSKFEMFYIF